MNDLKMLILLKLQEMGCVIDFSDDVENETCNPQNDDPVFCIDCKHLIFSDCYGECGAAHKGIVRPNDTCAFAERRKDGI